VPEATDPKELFRITPIRQMPKQVGD
jgi:hypothetical protein